MRFCFRKTVCLTLAICFTWLTIGFSGAEAKLVSTSQISEGVQARPDRERIKLFLEREDVQKQLEAWGLSKQEAKKRLANLTDEELATMARHLDQLPAGGNGVGAVVGAVVLIFLVLLITDILGFTDVFPFVR